MLKQYGWPFIIDHGTQELIGPFSGPVGSRVGDAAESGEQAHGCSASQLASDTTMAQIQAADPAARKRAILTIAVVAGIGSPIVLAFELYRPTLEAWFLEEPHRIKEKLIWLLLALIALSVVPVFGALYLWRMGQAIIRARRFPPPGRAVVVDTPISTGARAVWRGRLMKISAWFLAACAVAVPAVVWWASQRLLGGA